MLWLLVLWLLVLADAFWCALVRPASTAVGTATGVLAVLVGLADGE